MPKRNANVYKRTYTWIFQIAAQFTISQWTNKLWYMHIHCYSARRRHGLLLYTNTWVNFSNIMPIKRSYNVCILCGPYFTKFCKCMKEPLGLLVMFDFWSRWWLHMLGSLWKLINMYSCDLCTFLYTNKIFT